MVDLSADAHTDLLVTMNFEAVLLTIDKHTAVTVPCLLITGLEKWFPLTPISREDEVQGEILVETSLESYGEVSVGVVIDMHSIY